MMVERKKDLRLRPKNLTFVVMRPGFSKSGELLNISRGGLCFKFFVTIDPAEERATSLAVDIFIINTGWYLPRVPCTVIYDIQTIEATLFPTGIEYRCCGVQFGKLSKEQNRQLELYLDNHTMVMA